jgi:hypothetical protein
MDPAVWWMLSRFGVDCWILLFTVGSCMHRLWLCIFLGRIQYSNLSCKLANRMRFLLRYFLPLDMEFAHIHIYIYYLFIYFSRSIRKGIGSRNRNSSEEIRIHVHEQVCSSSSSTMYGKTGRLRNLSNYIMWPTGTVLCIISKSVVSMKILSR